MTSTEDVEGRVLILAPIGRDARAIAEVLRRIGLASLICADVPALVAALEAGAGAALVGEEALFMQEAEALYDWVAHQPPWSDMPFVILTGRRPHPGVLRWRQGMLKRLPNASLLEKPVDTLTLSSMSSAAARSRKRQYEVRSYINERQAAAETLEELVSTRTRELEAANAALRAEMSEREHAEDALRQAQKMEAVGQLTGGLAHDFNNMLAGISGSLDLIKDRLAKGRVNDIDRYLNAAQGASKRAAALTHRLLAFSRRQTLDPKPIDVNRLASGIEELIRRTVGPAITVEVVGAVGIWTILVDPNQLENALLNLCINSKDAMPDGGRLTIETGNRRLDEHGARERDLPPGQYVSLCVSDTGSGMTPTVAARAFDPFFTTKPIGMGTGLGLSMVFGFARQSGGQARIYSELGKGTTVCLYLPRHFSEAEAPEKPAELARPPQAEQGEVVLVVDDEPTVRMLVADVLTELGYTAIEALDGSAGLRILQSGERVDLVVTDVGLPEGMNGRQMVDAARVARPNLKVLFITGYAESAVVRGGHLEPGMHVLTKPFAIQTLASRIKELMAE
jgi:signal transduction histidine kinase